MALQGLIRGGVTLCVALCVALQGLIRGGVTSLVCFLHHARVAGIETLKNQVEMLKLAASEADQLEMRFASLASTASRLPVLRAQVGQLKEKCAELEQLEAEVEVLEKVRAEQGVGVVCGCPARGLPGGAAPLCRSRREVLQCHCPQSLSS